MDLGTAPERRASSVDREWTWPPGGSWPAIESTRWGTDEWAPATTVRRPLVRFGRWTLLYRRPGC